jgi:hypothetical protein
MGLGNLRFGRDRAIIRALEMFPLEQSERRLRNLHRCVAHGCSPEMRRTLRRRVATEGIPARLRWGCAVCSNDRDRGLLPDAVDIMSSRFVVSYIRDADGSSNLGTPLEIVVRCPRVSPLVINEIREFHPDRQGSAVRFARHTFSRCICPIG